MKVIPIAAALAVTGTAAFTGYMQTTYSKEAEERSQQLVDWINNDPLSKDLDIRATLYSFEGGLFASEGKIRIEVGERKKPAVFKVNYGVEHGALTALQGARYRAEIINSELPGSRGKTITSELFDGEPLIAEGVVNASELTGRITTSPVRLNEGRAHIRATPAVVDWGVMMDGSMHPKSYSVTLKLPELTVDERKNQLSIKSLEFATSGNIVDEIRGSGLGTLSLGKISFSKRDEGFSAENMAVSISSDVAGEITSDLSVTFDRFSLKANRIDEVVNNGAVTLSVGGFDTDSIAEVIELATQAQDEGWSDSRLQEAMQALLASLDDRLVSKSPHIELKKLALANERDQLLSGSGAAALDAQAISSGYIRSLVLSDSNDTSGFEKATKGSLNVTISREGERLAERISQKFGRLIRRLDGKLEVLLENGVVILNGERIRG